MRMITTTSFPLDAQGMGAASFLLDVQGGIKGSLEPRGNR